MNCIDSIGPLGVLMYHAVQDDWRSPLAVSRAEFEAHCRWLQRRRLVLPLDDWLRRFDRGRLERSFTALTFDDGFRSVYEVAFPILRKYGLPATVFVVGGTLGAKRLPIDWTTGTPPAGLATLSPDQISEMSSSRITFGSHGQTHRDLTTLSPSECERELIESRTTLEDVLGDAVGLFAYPLGTHNAAVRDAVERAGYGHAFGTSRGSDRVGRYAIPRAGVYPGDGVATLRVKVSRWYLPVRRSPLFPLLRRAVRRS